MPAIHNVINIKAIKWVFNLQPAVINEQGERNEDPPKMKLVIIFLHQVFETGLKLKLSKWIVGLFSSGQTQRERRRALI